MSKEENKNDKIEVEGKFYRLTAHAKHRARNRKITLEDLKEAISNPRTIRRNHKKGCEDSYRFTGRNDVIIVMNDKKNTIITVHKRNKNYANSKTKQNRNKKRLEFKRLYGNRAKK